MRISEVPARYIAGVRRNLRAMESEAVIEDSEMPVVAEFCAAGCDPHDAADHIAHDRAVVARQRARQYLVSADHPVAKYGCTDVVCEPKQDGHNGMWYVSIAGYGCSKNYRTPTDAIYGMLAEHACTNVRVRKLVAE